MTYRANSEDKAVIQQEMESLTYSIIGVGALGGTYGIKLANAGSSVYFLAHSDYSYIKKNGLRLDSVDGNIHLRNVSVYKESKDMPGSDVICICLKSTHNTQLEAMLGPLVRPDTVLLTLQNGLGIEEELQSMFPQAIVSGGLCYLAANKVGKGHIRHEALGRIVLGVLHPERDEGTAKRIMADFERAGIAVEFVEDLIKERWKKLMWNIPFNGLSVILSSGTDKIITNSGMRQLCREIMQELIVGAGACGYRIENEYVDELISLTEKLVPYKTSMMMDFENKRHMEIHYMYRIPLQKAKERGVLMEKVQMLERILSFFDSSMLD